MEICDIEFKGHRKASFRNAMRLSIKKGDQVIVEAERGEHIGTVSYLYITDKDSKELPMVVRSGTKEDRERLIKNNLREKEALKTCKQMVFDSELEMKIVDTEMQYDGNKMSFYFTAEERIDFRELVRKLASVYRTRIDMRQIGARDETKRSNCTIGSCGRPLCCGSFMESFKTVTMEAFEKQNLSQSSSKLLGACGRLKCCLLYEEGYYEEEGKRFPKMGARIVTESGPCKVIKIDVIGNAIVVRYESGAVERISRSRLGSGHCTGENCGKGSHDEKPDEVSISQGD
jgi:cell fate regulator YaaT (PSP1 superfamily)